MKDIFAVLIIALTVCAFFFVVVVAVGALSDPENWITEEQKKCEAMGGLFIQNSFSKDCIFKP